MNGETLLARLEDAAASRPHKAAVITGQRAVTFAELAAAIERRAMAEAGPAGRVALPVREHDPIAFLASVFAAMRLRRPALILPAGFALPDAALQPHNIMGEPCADEFLWGATSGTMGEPKLFARTHASWLASFAACESVFPFAPGDVVAAPGALSHTLFLYGAVHALCRGLTLIAPGTYAPLRLAALMRQARASVLYAVPAMLDDLIAVGGDAPALRLVFVGGQKLGGEARRRAEARWPRADIVEFYGASELSFVSYASTRHPAPPASVGRPFPGVRIEIRGGCGSPLPPGKAGTVHVASPMLFSRYVHPAAAPLASGEWATAGDLGFVDADGVLFLEGRAGRTINSKGRKLSPERIEAALRGHGAVARVAVIALPDGKRGEIAAAVIEPAAACTLIASQLRRHCRASLAPWELPRVFIAADAMPMTRSGKIALAELARAVASREPGFRVLQ
jgi:long-chain acyl-CoA synthetase